MRENILFEFTRENLETGLRGVPVGYSVTSFADPYKGLSYVGRPISELAQADPIAVVYLLYYGKTGTRQEVEKFEKELQGRAHSKKETILAIEALPRSGCPMDLFAAAILLAGMFELTGDYREDCLNVIAKVPELAATVINHHAGWGKTPSPDPMLGYMENFVHMLQTPGIDRQKLIPLFKMFNVLHYDHCGGNLSAFVGKAVASGLAHMYASLASSINALSGSRHGRANQDCLEFVKEIAASGGENATEADVEQFVRARLKKKQLIFGFGHTILRVEDPRATLFYQFAKERFPNHPLIKIALHLRKIGSKILSEDPKISNPFPNVDAISGSVLMAAGFTYPEYFTVLLGMSRLVGLAIQIVYERLEARSGKGAPIMRPLYLYKSRQNSLR